MAAPPRIKSFSREAVPGSPGFMDQVYQLLNESLGQLSGAVTRNLTRTENLLAGEKLGVIFTTPAIGAVVVPVKWDVVSRPKHVDVNGLAFADGTPVVDVWSVTWTLAQNNTIQLSFQGLTASKGYTCNVRWE
jgi:hypothetical protein